MVFVVSLLVWTFIGLVFLCAIPADQVIALGTLVLIMTQTLTAVTPTDIKTIPNVVNCATHMNSVLHLLEEIANVWADSKD